MSKILIEFSAGIGPLIRCLPIAIELRKRGHTVRYFARDNAWKHMAKNGFEALNVERERIAFRRDQINANWANGDEFWGLQGFADPAWLADRQGVWQAALAEYRPDVIVADWGMLSSIAARVMDIPLVMVTQSCLLPGVRGGRMRYWAPPTPVQTKTLDSINQYLASRGKRALPRFEELHVGTAGTVIPSFPEFDVLEPGLERNAVFTGPILAKGLINESSRPLPELRARPDEPRIFCYTGRMRDWGGNSGELLFQSVAAALRDTPAHLLIATGGMDDRVPVPEAMGACRVDVVDFIPMEIAYPGSRLVIHHGGHGSCMGLLEYGVPGLVLPTQSEREYNARAVADLGCGLFIPRDDLNGDAIHAAITKLLGDQPTLERTRHYQKVLATRYPDSAGTAAATILGALA